MINRLAKAPDVPAPWLHLRDDDGLEAVLAHEIAHIVSRDMSVVTAAYFMIAAAGRLMT